MPIPVLPPSRIRIRIKTSSGKERYTPLPVTMTTLPDKSGISCSGLNLDFGGKVSEMRPAIAGVDWFRAEDFLNAKMIEARTGESWEVMSLFET